MLAWIETGLRGGAAATARSRGPMMVALTVNALAGAGCPADSGDSDDAADSSGSGAESTTGPAATTVMSTAADSSTGMAQSTGPGGTTDTGSDSSSGTTGTPGSSTGTDTGTADTTTDSGTDSGTDTGTGTTGNNGAVQCAARCEVEFSCTEDWESEDACVSACEANLIKAAAFSPFCADAWENLAECQGGLTCEEFAEWQAPVEVPYPCSDEDFALAFECEGQ